MDKIKNILLCGLGAMGTYYAYKISKNKTYNFKVLLNKDRIRRYLAQPRIFNDETTCFDYISPDYSNFKADLVIISTKYYSLTDAISSIKNFVNKNTIILSLLNGVTSEDEINNVYKHNTGLYSFVLGHTFFRKGNQVRHDGQSKIFFGSTIKNDKRIFLLKTFFNNTDINFEISDDILSAMWSKFAFNCCVNQISAITGYNFEQMKSNQICIDLMRKITDEISKIANKMNINDYDEFFVRVINSLNLMIPDGKTSMLQDIEAENMTEINAFGKTVVRLGKKFNINTPYNRVISDIIEMKNNFIYNK